MKRHPITAPLTWCLLALCMSGARLLTGCGGGGNGGGGGGCVSGKPGASAPHVRVVDLGALGTQGGVTCSRPVGPEGLNGSAIVGAVDLGGGCSENDAVVWAINTSAASIAPTPLPGGQSSGGATITDADAINAAGQIVGQALQGAALTNAVVLWPNAQSAFTHLNDLPGADSSRANAINSSGLIVGTSNIFPAHPVYWQAGQTAPTQLAIPGPFTHGAEATAVNTQGQIVGWASDQVGGPSSALFWSGKQATAVTLPVLAGTKTSFANAINDAGQITGGFVAADGSAHAALWPNPQTTPMDLGLICGFASTTGVAINGRGQVVGTTNSTNSLYNNPGHAFYWDNTNGLLDLNNLIPANSGWSLIIANSIGDTGLIVGAGNLNGNPHGYLLVPSG